ncbi:hypothetical protein FGIG_03923 [Fasciola gigantica]|uniref:Uncharacterized protein n=1 Tax=Fasciola gigantica TaxID=46835 RepID=A0A504Z1W5_FASGI|nr:hypothetical protein FGIG_03923 [Fasciola gigantica]
MDRTTIMGSVDYRVTSIPSDSHMRSNTIGINSMLTVPRNRVNGGPFLRLPRAVLNAETLGDLEQINKQGVDHSEKRKILTPKQFLPPSAPPAAPNHPLRVIVWQIQNPLHPLRLDFRIGAPAPTPAPDGPACEQFIDQSHSRMGERYIHHSA